VQAHAGYTVKKMRKKNREVKKEKESRIKIAFLKISAFFRDKRVLLSSILLIALLFFVLCITRYERGMPLRIGSFSYYHERIAQSISENIMYFPNLYHYALALAGAAFGMNFASLALPLACGIACALLFYLILRKAGIEKKKADISLLVLVITPAFLYHTFSSSPKMMGIAAGLAAFYMMMQEKKAPFLLSVPLIILSAFFGFFNIMLISLMAAFYAYRHREKRRRMAAPAVAIAACIAFYIYFAFAKGISFFPLAQSASKIVFELGANDGLGIFALILAGIGFISMWKKKAEFYMQYLLAAIFTALMISNINANSYLSFICAFFSGSAIIFLMERRWTLAEVKNISMILVFCGLLFSTTLFMNTMSKAGPDYPLLRSAQWISDNSDSSANVLSHYENGFVMEYYGSSAFYDGNFYYAPEIKRRFNISSEIFYSRDIKKTKALLSNSSIDYIMITPEMRTGLVWKKEEQGLLFLLRDNETFKQVHTEQSGNDYTEIWQYLPKSNQ
jgi:hypothetical protein